MKNISGAASGPDARHQSLTASEAGDRRERGVTVRVVAICLVLAIALGYLGPVIDYKLFNTFLDGTHLPPGALGVLLVMVGVVNPLLRLLSRRSSFSRNELLTIYISCLFSSLVPGHGSENFIIPNLIAPFYFATRENSWLTWLQPYLKPWLTPALAADGSYQREVVSGWYEGLPQGSAIPWGAWLVPMVVWLAVVLVSYGMMACLSVLLRRQWAQNEALAFPLLELPLRMTDSEEDPSRFNEFWGSSKLWLGFGVAASFQAVRGLHNYFPDIPDLPQGLDFGPYFSEPPWNQLGWTPLQFYPIVVGISYLLTSEVSFSLWFFFWFIKFQLVAAYYLGFMPNALSDASYSMPGKTFVGYQVAGAYVVFVASVLWTGREHWRYVWRRATGREKARPDEKQEMLPYPLALWGFLSCLAAMIGFACLAGVRLDIALALWGAYLVIAIGLSRVAVEGGLLLLAHDSAPLGALARLLPTTNWLTLENGLMPASLMQAGFVVHVRGFILPSFLHAFKLAHDRRIAPRPLLGLLTAVILLSVVVSWTTVVRLGYENGGLSLGHKWFATWGSLWPVHFAEAMRGVPQSSPGQNALWLAVGATITWGIIIARSRLAWFPLHPIGYLMPLSLPGGVFWFPIMIGWACKRLILRFGGADSYRACLPFFLGLVLGDIGSILFWLVIDGWQGRTGHLLMPG